MCISLSDCFSLPFFADGYTAADVNFTMSSNEVKIADNLSVERFTLGGVETSYCTSKTSTGEVDYLSMIDLIVQILKYSYINERKK